MKYVGNGFSMGMVPDEQVYTEKKDEEEVSQ